MAVHVADGAAVFVAAARGVFVAGGGGKAVAGRVDGRLGTGVTAV